MAIWHITPLNDLKPHMESSICECSPAVETMQNGDLLIIHNSYDGREMREQYEEAISEIRGKKFKL